MIPLAYRGELKFLDLGLDDVFVITDGGAQVLVFIHNNGVILVDAPATMFGVPNGDFPSLIEAIASLTSNPITHMIYSHSHKDHIGGANHIKEAYPNVHIIAAKGTNRKLEASHLLNPDDPRPLPDQIVQEETMLDVGEQHIQLEVVSGHVAEGDFLLYSEQHKLLGLVDIVLP